MQKINYYVQTKSPVAFAEKNSDSTLYTTKKFVPGTAFRGMFASEFIRKYNLSNAHEDEKFFNIFLSGKVRFLPAYPLGKEKLTAYEPFILPISVTKSKVSGELCDLSDPKAKMAAGFKKKTGFALNKDGKIYDVDVSTQVDLHMGRTKDSSRISGSSKDGDIFNYEYIEPYQFFKGSILVDDDLADIVNKELSQINSQEVQLGHSKNVQYGKCEIFIDDKTNDDFLATDIDKNQAVYLYTLTPYIPYEDWQRIDEVAKNLLNTICQELNLAVQITDEDLQINDRLGIFASSEEITGFVNIWRAQHERKVAISAGSLIVIPAKILAQVDLRKLNELLYSGLGYRTSEGFGQFRLWTALKSAQIEQLAKVTPAKKTICDEVKTIAKAIIKQRILNEYKQLAAKHANREHLKMDEMSKHVLNRLETLMDSNSSKASIQSKIKAFKAKATNNLGTIYFDNDILLDILLEQENCTLPYKDFDFSANLNLPKAQLEQDLGADTFAISEDEKYRTYWLWFARHAKKEINLSSSDGEDLDSHTKVVK